jgi:molybdopterin converting factor subunit 1
MKFSVRFFATLKERVGASQLEIELPEPASVEILLNAMVQECPALEPAVDTIIVAINQKFADPDQILAPNDEVVLFPPVSGG